MLRECGLELAGHRARELPQVDLLRAELERAGLEPRKIEQIDRQLAQPLDLILDLLEEAAPRLRIELLVLEQLDEPAQREDRRAELMRCSRDELLARGLEPSKLALHLVEGHRKLSELVARVDWDRFLEVAGRDLLHRQHQPLDPLA